MGVAFLRVVRTRGYRDALRSYKLRLDSETVGRLQAGEELVWEIAPGEHTIRATIDWTGSPILSFYAEPGQETLIVVSPRAAFRGVFDVVSKYRYINIRREAPST